jgi:pimeloyl-ACP methyl ester carboxylesterase
MDFISSLLTILLMVLLVVLLISPFESLRWWAGWVSDGQDHQKVSESAGRSTSTTRMSAPLADQYVIFLSGVGALGSAVNRWEQSLLDVLHSGLHGGVVLTGLFPFTVRAGTLTEQRPTAWFWRWLAHLRETRAGVLAYLIDWRNLGQVFVSMDPRYGPIYSKGIEEKLAALLHEQGYVEGTGKPITLIGYSGGAQIALGASLYLAHDLHAPVSVISLGGVIGDDPALETVEHLYHLWGTKDVESRLATAMVPARWPISRWSLWNQAIAAHRVTQECLGAMTHYGPKSYLDAGTLGSDGRSFVEVTGSTMLRIIESVDAAQFTAPA